MTEPRLSVVVPARDSAATLADTLAGLAAQDGIDDCEVLVVDDGSSDETPGIAASSNVVSRVIHAGGGGPARARNLGAAEARSPRIAFLDSDCVPAPGWLRAGAAALDEADLVMGETRPRSDQEVGPFDRSLWVIGCSPLFESANLFVRRELFEALGGFESWLGPREGKELGEDVWFGWRARRAGARIVACPPALVHHQVFPRGPLGFAAERWRLRFFPALARRVPELRGAAFHRRYFLTPRAARFDAAVVGLLAAAVMRRALPLAAAIPYARVLSEDLRGGYGPRLAAGRLAADAVGLAAMAYGSARHRSLLI